MLLILAGVSIATLTGDNGIVTQANYAKTETEKQTGKENVQVEVLGSYGKDGKIDIDQLNENLKNIEGLKYNGQDLSDSNKITSLPAKVTVNGYEYEIDENGNVMLAIPGPTVTHTISPETQVAEGEKITITIKATATEGSIIKITKPDGTVVTNVKETIYEVEENGEYQFVIEGSNGGKTTYTVEITNGKEVEKFSDIYAKTTTYTDKNGKTATIPEGFAVGITSKINTIENGLVITNKIDSNHYSIGSEFVWVLVETVVSDTEANGTTNKAMAINLGTESAPQYRGLLYDFSGTSSTVRSGCTTTTSGYREPANLDTSYDDTTNVPNWTSTMYQKEYNLMIESVKEYGGFYVGRYETSINGETIASTKGTTATRSMSASESSGNLWYGMYQKQKEYSSKNAMTSVQSSMIWGSQYDAMLNWALKGADSAKVTGTGNAPHNLSASYQPGTQEDDKINNIYDLEGNRFEWSLEGNSSYHRIFRGGYFNGVGSPVRRSYNGPGVHDYCYGSRLSLCVQ